MPGIVPLACDVYHGPIGALIRLPHPRDRLRTNDIRAHMDREREQQVPAGSHAARLTGDGPECDPPPTRTEAGDIMRDPRVIRIAAVYANQLTAASENAVRTGWVLLVLSGLLWAFFLTAVPADARKQQISAPIGATAFALVLLLVFYPLRRVGGARASGHASEPSSTGIAWKAPSNRSRPRIG